MSKIQYKTFCTICRLDSQYDKMLCRALVNELNNSRIYREYIKKKKQFEDLEYEFLGFKWKNL